MFWSLWSVNTVIQHERFSSSLKACGLAVARNYHPGTLLEQQDWAKGGKSVYSWESEAHWRKCWELPQSQHAGKLLLLGMSWEMTDPYQACKQLPSVLCSHLPKSHSGFWSVRSLLSSSWFAATHLNCGDPIAMLIRKQLMPAGRAGAPDVGSPAKQSSSKSLSHYTDIHALLFRNNLFCWPKTKTPVTNKDGWEWACSKGVGALAQNRGLDRDVGYLSTEQDKDCAQYRKAQFMLLLWSRAMEWQDLHVENLSQDLQVHQCGKTGLFLQTALLGMMCCEVTALTESWVDAACPLCLHLTVHLQTGTVAHCILCLVTSLLWFPLVWRNRHILFLSDIFW